MTRMPDIFAEVEHDLGRLIHHEHHDAPQPAAAPAVPHNVIKEAPVSNVQALDAIADHVKAAARTFEAVDRDLIVKAEAIKATPEGATAFEMLHALAAAEGAQPVLSVVGVVLKGIADLPAAQPQPIASDAQPAPQQAAGPVIAGQA